MLKKLDKEGLKEDEDLKEQYAKLYETNFKKYEQLGKVLHQDLKKLLNDAKIDPVGVNYRIKDFNSFWDKIRRKNYDNPFNEINDICGLRIICYYTSDLDKIRSIIEEEFSVSEVVDKVELLKEDEFEYLSLHFIVKPNKDWLKTPSYRDIGDIKAEIQVRTILQHAWAGISHKLAYKKKGQVPTQFTRHLNSLSAILENADAQFESLRADRENYLEEISGAADNSNFDLNQELNLDSLQAFLDFYFPDRDKYAEQTSNLLDEINEYNKKDTDNISLQKMLKAYTESETLITIMDVFGSNVMEYSEAVKLEKTNPKKLRDIAENYKFFTQAGVIRESLQNVYEDYHEYLNKLWSDVG